MLSEGRDGILYHYMDARKSLHVFGTNRMEARWKHLIDDQEVMGNSFTRSSRLELPRPVRLHIDYRKLSQTHRIIPVDGERTFRLTQDREDGYTVSRDGFRDRVINARTRSGSPLSEEFVVGDIPGLHRYIEVVELMKPNFYFMSGSDAVSLFDVVAEYATEFGLEARIHPDFIENIERIKASWADDDY